MRGRGREGGQRKRASSVKTEQLGRGEGRKGRGGENKRKKEMKSYKTHLEKMYKSPPAK